MQEQDSKQETSDFHEEVEWAMIASKGTALVNRRLAVGEGVVHTLKSMYCF